MKLSTIALIGSLLSLAGGAAIAAGDHAQHGSASPAATAAASPAAKALTSGEVRKVDTEQGKVTIKHEAIANLEMPPMTMVFRAQSPEMVKDLKVGEKVRFQAENSGGGFVVTHIERGG